MTDIFAEFENGDITLADMMKMEGDRRKIEHLIDTGVVSREDVDNAVIYEIEPTCKCDRGLAPFGEFGDLRCPKCRKRGKAREI